MSVLDGAGSYRAQIVENYQEFEPPPRLRGWVEELLNDVPAKYLVGLSTVILTNQNALTRDQRRQKIWGRKRKYRLAEVRGAYYGATKFRPAYVLLLVDNILRSVPSWVLRMPLLCYTEISEVLYHEVGHHIHAVHARVHDGKENVAEDWQRKLKRRFVRKHYWFLLPVVYPASNLAKFILRSATWKKFMEANARRRG
jgi:hypothetical protein